jgi:hypothetical protein
VEGYARPLCIVNSGIGAVEFFRTAPEDIADLVAEVRRLRAWQAEVVECAQAIEVCDGNDPYTGTPCGYGSLCKSCRAELSVLICETDRVVRPGR